MERRAAIRHRLFKAATIGVGEGAIDCIVKNRSQAGAALEVAKSLFIPDRFTLSDAERPIDAALPYRVADKRTDRHCVRLMPCSVGRLFPADRASRVRAAIRAHAQPAQPLSERCRYPSTKCRRH